MGGRVLLNLLSRQGYEVRTRLWRTRFERIKSTKTRECLGVNVLVNSKRDQIKANQSFKT